MNSFFLSGHFVKVVYSPSHICIQCSLCSSRCLMVTDSVLLPSRHSVSFCCEVIHYLSLTMATSFNIRCEKWVLSQSSLHSSMASNTENVTSRSSRAFPSLLKTGTYFRSMAVRNKSSCSLLTHCIRFT